MRKTILSAIAATFLLAPVLSAVEASAQSRHELRQDRRELREDRRDVRQDRREIRRDRRNAGRPAWLKRGGRYGRGGSDIRDYRRYGLRAPGRGQRWVRYGNDYLLVSVASGLIASIIVAQ